MGAELFHEEGRTAVTKLIDAFRNFVNATINIVLVTDTERQELMSTYTVKLQNIFLIIFQSTFLSRHPLFFFYFFR